MRKTGARAGIVLGIAAVLSAAGTTAAAEPAPPGPEPVAVTSVARDGSAGTRVSGMLETLGMPARPFTTVHANYGSLSSVALTADGQAYAWGSARTGMGGGENVPTPVLEDMRLAQIAFGGSNQFMTDTDGVLWASGSNTLGALGVGVATSTITEPRQVVLPEGVDRFTAVAASATQSLGLSEDGRVWGWGQNNGALGLDPEAPSGATRIPAPVVLPDGVRASVIAAGESHFVLLSEDGDVYTWGSGSSGALGHGVLNDRIAVPTRLDLPGAAPVVEIASGQRHTLARTADGEIYAWGYNHAGALGDDTATDSAVPVRVQLPDGVRVAAMTAGFVHSVAITDDGELYAWGLNTWGELGNGSSASSRVPRAAWMPPGVRFVQVAAGHHHTSALTADGDVYSWGWNQYRQLGHGITSTREPYAVLSSDVVVTSVTFDGVAGTDPARLANHWTALAPAGLCGPVDVEVAWTQWGQSGTRMFPGAASFGTPPEVTEHPEAVTREGPGLVTLSAAADSTEDGMTVAWQRTDDPELAEDSWTDIPEADGETLTLHVDRSTHVRAVFASCAGSTATEAAAVIVTPDEAGRVPGDPGDPGDPGAPPPGGGDGDGAVDPGDGGDGLAVTGATAGVLGLAALLALIAGAALMQARRTGLRGRATGLVEG